MLTILVKAYCPYCANIVVDIKPIYLNKRYLFQNKICFAKIKFCKLTLYKLVTRLLKKIDFMQRNIKIRHVLCSYTKNRGSFLKCVVPDSKTAATLYIFSK